MAALKILGRAARVILAIVLTPIGAVLGAFANLTNSILVLTMIGGFVVCGVFAYLGHPKDAIQAAIVGGIATLAFLAHIAALEALAPYWRRDTPRTRVEYHDSYH